jgi:hypothetical protein
MDDKRFQVFVSSTYEDLMVERQEVMHALLELDCIPSGMELFPAASEDQWTVIQRVIDDCDYYMVIVAGKYGSTDAAGQSYTEREYRYALERKKPIIGFLHKDPSSLAAKLTEQDPPTRKKLEDFRELVQKKLCKFWTSAPELASVVSRSLLQLIKTHPAIGWVRADRVSDETEILHLRKQIDVLEAKLSAISTAPPPGTEHLAQGDDTFDITFTSGVQFDGSNGLFYETRQYPGSYRASWNEIFGGIAPILIDEAGEYHLQLQLAMLPGLVANWREQVQSSDEIGGAGMYTKKIHNITVSNESFQTIKVQLRALGLITKSTTQHSVKDNLVYWTLTPYGDAVMTNLRAIRRGS